MASLGSPRTRKFQIGTAELRVGALASAMKLTQANSVGLIDEATVTVGQENVDLEGGFPRVLVDTAIIRQTAEVSATLREYSRANFNILVGNGITTNPSDIATTAGATGTADATSLTLASGTGIVAGDLLTVYNAGQPENVMIVRVESIATDTVTLDANTPLLFDVALEDPVFVSAQVAVGAVTQTNYMSVQLVQKENATGRPLQWHFWKAAINANLEYATSVEDFASTQITLKCLQPSASEYEVEGSDLVHLAAILPTHPIGMYVGGGE